MKYRESTIAKLARSQHWQVLYSRAKELNLNIFKNSSDFSRIQILFLQYLELYNSLYTDIAMGKEHIDEKLLSDEISVQAYLTYKRTQAKKENRKEFTLPKKKNQKARTKIPSVRFRKARKARR